MGKGGYADPKVLGRNRVPATPPDKFSVGVLRKAIPAHCFERSTLTSSLYLVTDLAIIAALYYATTWFSHPSIPSWLTWGLLWPAYWFCQGAVSTGVWVISHECGHQSFSPSQAVNDGVGFVFHTLLLVPYYSWYGSTLAVLDPSSLQQCSACQPVGVTPDELVIVVLQETLASAASLKYWQCCQG